MPIRDGFCISRVTDSGSVLSRQCSMRNGYGPEKQFCRIHDPAAEAARNEKSRARWNAKHLHEVQADRLRSLNIAADLLAKDGDSLAAQACRNLADKLRKATE